MTGKCTPCSELKEQLLKYRKLPAIMRELFRRRDTHFRVQRGERLAYYTKILEAISQPLDVLSAIVDGYDTMKSCFPVLMCV